VWISTGAAKLRRLGKRRQKDTITEPKVEMVATASGEPSPRVAISLQWMGPEWVRRDFVPKPVDQIGDCVSVSWGRKWPVPDEVPFRGRVPRNHRGKRVYIPGGQHAPDPLFAPQVLDLVVIGHFAVPCHPRHSDGNLAEALH
jgi:hypothetical protein